MDVNEGRDRYASAELVSLCAINSAFAAFDVRTMLAAVYRCG